ncbi:GLPGLI family protein [Muricauda sp. SCSIO 64092]|nr:GLPGLI family protein [Muricauda sp. SCSIO 64092]
MFFFGLSQAQEGEITYRTYAIETAKKDTDYSKKITREINRMRFSLLYTKSHSYCFNIQHVPDNRLSANLALIAAGSPKDWYQDSKQRVSFYEHKIRGKRYVVLRHDRMQGWELNNSSKMIEGYQAYKANLKMFNDRTSKYKLVEAWYSPELPLPYGPAGFGGLPGLILELRAGPLVYVSEKIIMNPQDGIKEFIIPSLNNVISPNELVKLMRANRKVTPD